MSTAIRPKFNTRSGWNCWKPTDHTSKTKVGDEGGHTSSKEDETSEGLALHRQVDGLEATHGEWMKTAMVFGIVKDELERTEENGVLNAPNDGDKTSNGLSGLHTDWTILAKPHTIGLKNMKISSVATRAWVSENNSDPGPCYLDTARGKSREFGPMCFLPNQTVSTNISRFSNKFGRLNGDGGQKIQSGKILH